MYQQMTGLALPDQSTTLQQVSLGQVSEGGREGGRDQSTTLQQVSLGQVSEGGRDQSTTIQQVSLGQVRHFMAPIWSGLNLHPSLIYFLVVLVGLSSCCIL